MSDIQKQAQAGYQGRVLHFARKYVTLVLDQAGTMVYANLESPKELYELAFFSAYSPSMTVHNSAEQKAWLSLSFRCYEAMSAYEAGERQRTSYADWLIADYGDEKIGGDKAAAFVFHEHMDFLSDEEMRAWFLAGWMAAAQERSKRRDT